MKFIVMVVTKDKFGVKTHSPIGEFDKYSEASELCRHYRDKRKVDHFDAYVVRIDPAFPLFVPPA
jgi:hypothetical protein